MTRSWEFPWFVNRRSKSKNFICKILTEFDWEQYIYLNESLSREVLSAIGKLKTKTWRYWLKKHHCLIYLKQKSKYLYESLRNQLFIFFTFFLTFNISSKKYVSIHVTSIKLSIPQSLQSQRLYPTFQINQIIFPRIYKKGTSLRSCITNHSSHLEVGTPRN